MLAHRRWQNRRPQHLNNLKRQGENTVRALVIRTCEGEPCSCS